MTRSSASLRAERMLAALSSAYGVLALLLAIIGCTGRCPSSSRSAPEIGVRMALGASRRRRCG
jgi:hypothetical protein